MGMAFGRESRFLKDPSQKEDGKAQGLAAFPNTQKKIRSLCLQRPPLCLLPPVGETTVPLPGDLDCVYGAAARARHSLPKHNIP